MSTSRMMRGMTLGQKIAFQWRRGWHEIPEVMVTNTIVVFSAITLGYLVYDYDKRENKTQRYKHETIIYRSGDPRVELLHRDERSPPFTKTPCP